MKFEWTTRIAVLTVLLYAGWCTGEVRKLESRLGGMEKQARPTTPAELPSTNMEARLKKLETGSSGVGGIMLEIQLHFAKLYYASEARNWDLALFERNEIEGNLQSVALLRPEERGVGIAGIIEAFRNTQLAAMSEAIEVKDRGLFRKAYQDSIQMCNTCHEATGRSFITITIPNNPPVPNQKWEPRGFGGQDTTHP